jgi:hypothetical protein
MRVLLKFPWFWSLRIETKNNNPFLQEPDAHSDIFIFIE